MRIVVMTEPWPLGEDDMLPARDAADLVAREWFAAAPHVRVVALPVGRPDPRCADALPGRRMRVGGADAVDTAAGLVLAPAGGARRWDPDGLRAALLALAAQSADAPGRLPVVVPLGDEAPAGDATALWDQGLTAVRAELSALSITALTTSQRPLLGFRGMAAATVQGRGADPALLAAAQEQEDRWGDIALRAERELPARVLLGPARLADTPGAGAAGGLAYCLAALGAALTQGAPFVADMAGLRAAADGADLVVAVTGALTPRALDTGMAAPAALEAARRGVPCVVVAPEVEVGKRDLMAAGVSSAHAAGHGADALADQVRRVAHTWTPQPG